MNKKNGLLALALLILAAGCKEIRYQKAEDGSEYKVYTKEKGKLAEAGNFMQLNVLVTYKDSILFSTEENGMPQFIPYDTMSLPKFFRTIHEGDSLVICQSTDSIIAMGQNPEWMLKGNYVIQSIKVAKVFPNQEAADSVAKTFAGSAKAKQYKKRLDEIEKDLGLKNEQMSKDDKIISDYLAKDGLGDAQKTKWGTYVVITEPGSGPTLTEADVAEVNYTGRTFKDSTFDSNTLKEFGHVEPLYVDLGEFRVIPGWIDGLKLFQKGSKGKIIIPSTLAYGDNGAPPKIEPHENLVFDIEVTDVISQEQYQKKMEEQQRMMQMMQQQMQQQMQEQMQKQQQENGQ